VQQPHSLAFRRGGEQHGERGSRRFGSVKGRLPRAAPASGVGDGLQLHRPAAQQCRPPLPLLFFFTNSGAAAPARRPPSGGLACRPGGVQLVQRRDDVRLSHGRPPVPSPLATPAPLFLLPL
jgi:hypothetical protein